jgi:hypothetical protein
MFLAFLTKRNFDFGIKIGNFKRIGAVKMEELVEVMGMRVIYHQKRFGDAVPENGEIFLTDDFMLSTEKH